jgi:hypothetical protein
MEQSERDHSLQPTRILADGAISQTKFLNAYGTKKEAQMGEGLVDGLKRGI